VPFKYLLLPSTRFWEFFSLKNFYIWLVFPFSPLHLFHNKYLQLNSIIIYKALFYQMTYSPQKFLAALETHSEWQITTTLDAVHSHRKRLPWFNWHSKNFADMQVTHREINSQFVWSTSQGEAIVATVTQSLSNPLTTKPKFLQDFDLNHTGTSPEWFYCLIAASLEIPL